VDSEINYSTEWLNNEIQGRWKILENLSWIKSSFGIKSKFVIELGSGIGTNLKLFNIDNRVLGIEGMRSAVEESINSGIPTIQQNLELQFELDGEKADCILCMDVLEHLVQPNVCLQIAHKLLKDGGILVVNIPNHFDWRGRLRILFGSGIDSQKYFPDSKHWEYPHLRFFQNESIKEILNHSGFEVHNDLSPQMATLPRQKYWKALNIEWIGRYLAKKWPNLFSAGFFLVCKKSLKKIN